MIRVLSRIIAFALIAEAMFGALRLAALLPQLLIYDWLAILLILAGGATGALQFIGGWLLANRRPAALFFARTALLASAVLTILDDGLRLAPSNVYYWFRWQYVAGYVIYALIVAAVLTATYRSNDPSIHRSN